MIDVAIIAAAWLPEAPPDVFSFGDSNFGNPIWGVLFKPGNCSASNMFLDLAGETTDLDTRLSWRDQEMHVLWHDNPGP